MPDDKPLVFAEPVKGAQRIAAVDRNALALGLGPGLTLADARARVPEIVVAPHDPEADAAILDLIAEDCDRWTPLVALDPPHGLVLDVTGCAHLFGGETNMRISLVTRLLRLGFEVRAAIAGTPDAARALARLSKIEIVPPGGEAAAVRPLSIDALEAPEETRIALSRAGLKRIADLADRPVQPIAERFGSEITRKLACLLGLEDRRITPLRPLPVCMVEQPFPEPIVQADDVAGCLKRLIGRAALMLEQRGEGGRIFEAGFFRADGAVRRVRIGTGRPSRDAAAIGRLFGERLDALADPVDAGFGFDLIRLVVLMAEPMSDFQPSLDGKRIEEDELADLIDRLVARFGPERVLRFAAADTHHPERAARSVPGFGGNPVPWPSPEPGEPPSRPLQLFDPPQPVETLAEVPDGPPIRFRWRRVLHEVARAEGPERIAPEWWRDHDVPTRDYYRVEDAEGRRFWLYRAGLYGRETETPRWYLHGLFA